MRNRASVSARAGKYLAAASDAASWEPHPSLVNTSMREDRMGVLQSPDSRMRVVRPSPSVVSHRGSSMKREVLGDIWKRYLKE
jgi:hypothetical protein